MNHADGVLTSHNIDDARLEAEILLMHALGVRRAELYTRLAENLTSATAENYHDLIQRRCSHEPTAYILKHCQFYGIDFYIDPRALIPRPESEFLVEEGLSFASRHFPHPASCLIADVGTGSGALAIALALHLPEAEIYAMDISADALEVARINCEQHQVEQKIHLLLGDMLLPLTQKVDLIIANLPYVKNEDLQDLSPEIRVFEPGIALSGGDEGLDKIYQLLSQAKHKLLPGGLVLLEIGQGQADAVASMARSHFHHAQIDLIPDFGGIKRVVRILS
ncbi:peptide chain release factor N(5)-glutamine methyltransferase [Chloroflexota bacterium]